MKALIVFLLYGYNCNGQLYETRGDPSLLDVYNNMKPPMEKDQWHIHDPSKIVATDGILMIANTGKEQADGYK